MQEKKVPKERVDTKKARAAEEERRKKAAEEEANKKAAEILKSTTDLLEATQKSNAVAKEILNLPDVFEVAGRKVEIRHLSPKALLAVNMAVIDTHKIRAELPKVQELETLEMLDKSAEYWERLTNDGIDIIFHLINPNPFAEDVEFSKDWIAENIPFTDAGEDERLGEGMGVTLIKAYRARLETTNFFQEVWKIPVM